jgi:transposase
MIPLSPATRIFLASGATDLRKSFEGLSDLVSHQSKEDPLSGHLYVFANRRKNRIKLLYFDGYENTEIMGRRFRPKGPFRGKTVFPVRGDGPIILTGSATGFVLGLFFD